MPRLPRYQSRYALCRLALRGAPGPSFASLAGGQSRFHHLIRLLSQLRFNVFASGVTYANVTADNAVSAAAANGVQHRFRLFTFASGVDANVASFTFENDALAGGARVADQQGVRSERLT